MHGLDGYVFVLTVWTCEIKVRSSSSVIGGKTLSKKILSMRDFWIWRSGQLEQLNMVWKRGYLHEGALIENESIDLRPKVAAAG